MELSKRLKMIADYVSDGAIVADIGTDHAYLPIYLVENNIAKKVIAMDINKGPLNKAKENVAKYGLSNSIELRLSNGLEKLNENEVDTVIVAGMGGMLVHNILKEHSIKLNNIKKLILQPQSDYETVRKTIHSLGFKIIDEEMIIDSEKVYFIMVCKQGKEHYDKEVDYKFGKILIEKSSPIFQDYIAKNIKTAKKIIAHLQDKQSKEAKERIEELKKELMLMEEVLR